jgi:hypothetical protein
MTRGAAASVVARTRVDNSALARGMNEADRVMQQGARQMQRSASSAGAVLGSDMGAALMSALVGYVKGWSVLQIGRMAFDLGQMGAQAERMEQSFRSLAGSGASRMLEELRETSRGTISDMNLMMAANRAMMLGVTQDTETMTRLMEIAMVHGRAMGLSTQQAFSDIVTGIGRMSPLILDNLGIMTGGERMFSEYAATLGKTVDQLSDVEKRQALLNKVMQETTDVAAPDAQEAYERFAAQGERLNIVFGKLLGAEGGIGAAAANLGATLISGITGYFEGAYRAREITIAFEHALNKARDAGELTTAQWLAMRAATWVAGSGAEYLGGRTDELYDALRTINPEIAAHVLALYDLGEAANNAEEAHRNLRSEMQEVTRKAVAAGRAVGMDPWLVRRLHDPQAGRGESIQDQILRDEEALREWEQAATRALRGGGGISDAQRLAEQRAREFQSLVESVLSPTQVTGADMSATEHGAYRDKWDEYIRRLRADQSIPYYQRMEQERLFYSGQMLDQVNWDAMIEDIARRQQEEIGRQNLLNEAMRRAQEAGLGGMGRADVAAALGIHDPKLTGADHGIDFAKGMASIDLGVEVTAAFEKQFQKQEERWEAMGSLSVRWIGQGVESGVMGPAGDTLVRALLPKLLEALGGRA